MSESAKPELLIDTLAFKPLVLEGNQNNGDKFIVRGEFARGDRATENRRLYRTGLWEREIKRLEKSLKENTVLGEADHPESGRTSLKRVSHILTNLQIVDNVVVGECVILNTTEGKNLKAIFEGGGSIGVSSRGFGTVTPGKMGESIVNDDYKLITFDFVVDPANPTSYPTVYKESIEATQGVFTGGQLEPETVTEAKITTLSDLKESNPALWESFISDAEKELDQKLAKKWAQMIVAEKQAGREEGKEEAKADAAQALRAEFADNLKSALEQMRQEVATTVRAELMQDPEVAAAKPALENIKAALAPLFKSPAVVEQDTAALAALQAKLDEANLKIKSLEEQNAELAQWTKEAAYKYKLECIINQKGPEHAELVRNLVGNVTKFESLKDLEKRVSSIMEEITVLKDKAAKAAEAKDAEVKALQIENKRLESEKAKALTEAKKSELNAYFEKRLKNHPKAGAIRAIFERVGYSAEEDINVVLESFRDSKLDSEQLSEARSRVRSLNGSNSKEFLNEDEKPAVKRKKEVDNQYHNTGASIEYIKEMIERTK
jgi:hypothetical protein